MPESPLLASIPPESLEPESVLPSLPASPPLELPLELPLLLPLELPLLLPLELPLLLPLEPPLLPPLPSLPASVPPSSGDEAGTICEETPFGKFLRTAADTPGPLARRARCLATCDRDGRRVARQCEEKPVSPLPSFQPLGDPCRRSRSKPRKEVGQRGSRNTEERERRDVELTSQRN